MSSTFVTSSLNLLLVSLDGFFPLFPFTHCLNLLLCLKRFSFWSRKVWRKMFMSQMCMFHFLQTFSWNSTLDQNCPVFIPFMTHMIYIFNVRVTQYTCVLCLGILFLSKALRASSITTVGYKHVNMNKVWSQMSAHFCRHVFRRMIFIKKCSKLQENKHNPRQKIWSGRDIE